MHQHLWPDVEVDFDRSLHFCMHQLRGALEEATGRRDWIETLPRRGYRFRPPTSGTEPGPDLASRPRSRRTALVVAMALLVVVVLAVAGVRWRGARAPGDARVGVLPWPTTAVWEAPESPSVRLAPAVASLLDRLAELGPALRVVGPSSTSWAAGSFSSIGRLGEELELDLVVNFRPVGASGESGAAAAAEILIEILRIPDGEHLWVARRSVDADPEAVAAEVAAALVAEL